MDPSMMKQMAWIGDEQMTGRIRGVVLVFHDLGFTGEKSAPDTVELEWARAGWLVVFPYHGPWSWMNRQARAFVDDLVDTVYQEYELGNHVPLAATGCGMGGLAALLHARYARRPVAACLALSPVCDIAHHIGEGSTPARSIRHALLGYGDGMEALYAEHSPLMQAGQLPDIPYLIIHGDQDQVVNKAAHSDRMVAALKEHGRTVEYLEIPGMGHDTCVPMVVPLKMIQFLARLPINAPGARNIPVIQILAGVAK